ncbi:MAG: glyoxalase [Planctomycetota bacterium]|nr:MAG: glyoxalase [Planctomycetota bacterium]
MAIRDSYKHGEFCWVDLASHDQESAATFYCQVFGWELRQEDTHGGPPYSSFTLERSSVAGLGEISSEMQEMGVLPTWSSYINVDDIEAVVAQAQELGATVTAPVMQIADAGKTAFLMDPAGTSFALWQAGNHAGAKRSNEENSFCWVELATRDFEKAKAFYTSLFGWNYRENPHTAQPYLIIENQGRTIGGMLLMTEEWGDHPPYWGVYFGVTNVSETKERVESAGGQCLHGPFDTPVGPMGVMQDPQGAIFSVMQAGKTC